MILCKLIRKVCADNLGAVKAEDRINDIYLVAAVAAKLLCNCLSLRKTGFLSCNINIVIAVRMVGCKMSLRNTKEKIASVCFDFGYA